MISKTFIALTFMILCSVNAFAQGNGADRGGGDLYVSEFQAIKRKVLSSVKGWVEDGTLVLSSEENERFWKRVPSIVVFSSNRVYIDPKDPGTEVTLLNQPNLLPPRITIGQERWKFMKLERTPVEIELICLHELLSASGIHDAEFEKSYALQIKRNQDWIKFRADFKELLEKNFLETEKALRVPMANLYTAYLDGMFEDSDYERCMSMAGRSKKALDNQKTYCDPFITKVWKGIRVIGTRYIAKPMSHSQERMRQQRSNILEFIFGNLADNRDWKAWALKVFLDYDEVSSQAIEKMTDLIEKANNNFLDNCKYSTAVDKTAYVSCSKQFLYEEMPLVLNSTFEEALIEISKAYKLASKRVKEKSAEPLEDVDYFKGYE